MKGSNETMKNRQTEENDERNHQTKSKFLFSVIESREPRRHDERLPGPSPTLSEPNYLSPRLSIRAQKGGTKARALFFREGWGIVRAQFESSRIALAEPTFGGIVRAHFRGDCPSPPSHVFNSSSEPTFRALWKRSLSEPHFHKSTFAEPTFEGIVRVRGTKSEPPGKSGFVRACFGVHTV